MQLMWLVASQLFRNDQQAEWDECDDVRNSLAVSKSNVKPAVPDLCRSEIHLRGKLSECSYSLEISLSLHSHQSRCPYNAAEIKNAHHIAHSRQLGRQQLATTCRSHTPLCSASGQKR